MNQSGKELYHDKRRNAETGGRIGRLREGTSPYGRCPDREKEEASAAEDQKKLTLEDVRRVAADKARQGHTDEVRQLIQKFGADKLSGVDAAKYPALMEELEAMGHAD